MNRPIRRVSVVMCVFFALLLANITYSTVFRHDLYAGSEYNRRVRNEEFGHDRGRIWVGNTAIAQSTASDDSLKFKRSYPQGPVYAPVTGSFTYAYGQTELERAYNTQLAGSSDSLAFSRMLDQFTGKTPTGASLQTTLNPKAQQAAYDALRRINAKGAVVALNPQTGAVLAAVSTPSYDPNALATHDLDAAARAQQQLTDDPDQPTQNRAMREVYPPGSTFKVVVAAAALENGMKPETLVDAPDALTLPQTTFQLTNQGECGNTKITIDKALTLSCNTAFANLGMQLGEDKVAAQAKKFGFGDPHLTDLGGVASRFPTGMNEAQLAQSSIGQFDVATSPLQMAMVAAAIANDGKVMDPYVVGSVQAPDLATISSHNPKQLGQAMSAEHAKQLQQMMFHVVDTGSGTNAKIQGVQMGGKTGTAQTAPGVAPYGWFIAFGPGPNPTFALAVAITDSSASSYDKNYAGANIAAPVAKSVAQALLS